MSILPTLHTKTQQDVMSCCLGWVTIEHVHLPMAGHFLLTRALYKTGTTVTDHHSLQQPHVNRNDCG